jgi:hypothetical protein
MKQLDVFTLESYHMNYLFNEIEINHSQKKAPASNDTRALPQFISLNQTKILS